MFWTNSFWLIIFSGCHFGYRGGILDKKEYDAEDNKIRQGLIDILKSIKKNRNQLEQEEKVETPAGGEDNFFNAEEETLVDKASKIVVLFLMGAAAILLIYFIAFHENEDTQLTGILASGGVVFVSLFKPNTLRFLIYLQLFLWKPCIFQCFS